MKKYQVFVSSTYEDLKEERKEVIQALLELDCIPVGMELFPATDDDQWTLIKELIEDCDYYILLIGGRYGSLNKDGISFTQMEYEYAISCKIPCISFLHKSPDKIIVGKTDKNQEKETQLNKFRELASEKMIKHWETSEQLGSVVSRSLIKLIKTKPRPGWVKSNRISSEESSLEILRLKQRIQELEEEFIATKDKENESLSQGNDKFKISYNFKKGQNVNFTRDQISVTWNEIFSKTCAVLIDEATEEDYRLKINSYITFLAKKKVQNISTVSIIIDDFMSILIQLKALGLIEKSNKNRSLKDKNTYWKLTAKGDALITNLRAIKRVKK
jgi:hypothetical protein